MKLLEYYKRDIDQLQLLPAGGGRFEVTVDDTRVFSKLEADRFPEYEEIKGAIEALIAG